jgi:hypothetical protein
VVHHVDRARQYGGDRVPVDRASIAAEAKSQLTCRVPVFGRLQFVNPEGQPSSERDQRRRRLGFSVPHSG